MREGEREREREREKERERERAREREIVNGPERESRASSFPRCTSMLNKHPPARAMAVNVGRVWS